MNQTFLGSTLKSATPYAVHSISSARFSVVPTAAELGPEIIRTASAFMSTCGVVRPISLRAPKGKFPIATQVSFSDYGDHEFPKGSEEIQRLQENIFHGHETAFPILLLGDDSCNFPLIAARGGTIIHVDAHDDRNPFIKELTHANFIAHLMSLSPTVRVLQLGVRGYCDPRIKYAKDPRLKKIDSTHELKRELNLLPPNEAIYALIDIDVLDPTHFPHVACPEPLGWSWKRLRKTLSLLARDPRLKILTVSEFSPRGPKRDQLIAGLAISELIIEFALTREGLQL